MIPAQVFQLFDHGGDSDAENCLIFETYDKIQGDVVRAKRCYRSGQILLVSARLLGPEGRVHHYGEGAYGIRMIVVFEISVDPALWAERVNATPLDWAPLHVKFLEETCEYEKLPYRHSHPGVAKMHKERKKLEQRALRYVESWPSLPSGVRDLSALVREDLETQSIRCVFQKSSFGLNYFTKAILQEVRKSPSNPRYLRTWRTVTASSEGPLHAHDAHDRRLDRYTPKQTTASSGDGLIR